MINQSNPTPPLGTRPDRGKLKLGYQGREPMTSQEVKPTPERRILDATLDTIADHKISGTRMRHIAEKAGMSQANLHYYFPTKRDLFHALLDDMLKGFIREREQNVDDASLNPKAALAVFFQQEDEILKRRATTMKVFFDFWVQGTRDQAIGKQIQRMYAVWRRDMAKVVARGVEQGVFDSTYAMLVPGLMLSLMDGGALQYLIERDCFDLVDYLAAAYEMVLRLLCTAGEVPAAPPV